MGSTPWSSVEPQARQGDGRGRAATERSARLRTTSDASALASCQTNADCKRAGYACTGNAPDAYCDIPEATEKHWSLRACAADR
jgi:hypothetical protein